MSLVWRLGLGWLVGRRLLLLTTAERRVAVPFRFFAGTFYVPLTSRPWVADLERSPAATVQAWPGPRSVRARPITDTDEAELARRLFGHRGPVLALSPTGQRTPDMTAPDLVWVWPALAAAWWLITRSVLREHA